MKVGPTGRVRPIKTTVKAGKGRGTSAFKDALEEAAAATVAPTSAPLTGVEAGDALLAIQEVDPVGGDDRRSLAHRRGERLLDRLDRLDEIRLGLLSGGVAADRLTEIAALVAEKRGSSGDPALEQALDEIELRVKVELAKLGR